MVFSCSGDTVAGVNCKPPSPGGGQKSDNVNVKTQALQAARAVWPRLAHVSGRDPEAYDVTLVSARSEGEGRVRVVAVAQANERVVIKFRVGGKPGEVVHSAQAHRSAIETLADMPDCAAPEIIATDTGTGAMALIWVEGATLRDVFASDPGAVRPVMGHAGRWMAALHSRGPVDFVPFKGDWMLQIWTAVPGRVADRTVRRAREFRAVKVAAARALLE